MSELLKRLEREVLPLVSRPGRYTGGERNVPAKSPDDADLTFLLAFPDVYEIGMSHLGIRVLYDILNRRPDISAERTFAPWIDMEERMRERGIPLFSIESHREARDFDVVGFTLQYELHYTNVLAMLDLAGIPLRACDRGDDDPIVAGGGPCAFNPEPVAPFFDLFVIGDGETAVLDLADAVIEARRDGAARGELLGRAAAIPGVYVPSLYDVKTEGGDYAGTHPVDDLAPARVGRRLERELGYEAHPAVPIVPVTETTHDRLALEVARGCTRGCRFCQPGMVTRPVRPRPVEDVVRLAEEGVAGSGYDEISLVSLSTSDYPELPGLVSCLNERLFDRKVSISLPSLRADRFGLELADGIGRVRRAGLTFAPEAGTQRLRDVVNKNETEERILSTADVAFASGWKRIKLYFMIGLPTETGEDLEGIVGLVSRVREVARRHSKGARLSVSVSPFVPKPHTPFQWERQDSPETTREKEAYLRTRLRVKGVKLALRDPEVSFLEGVMARGDRRLALVVERAFRAGARFDGWTETFNFDLWKRAFEEESLDPASYLGPIDTDAPLPWDHIDGGPSKAFLRDERERALAGELTPDCREATCQGCGACFRGVAGARVLPARAAAQISGPPPGPAFGRRDRRVRRGANGQNLRWRVQYSKDEKLRFLSHLDVVRVLSRALAMSQLPLVYTQGFNPRPKLSLSPPLPVGTTGEAEFVELELTRHVDAAELRSRLEAGLPDGISIVAASPMTSKLSASAVAEAAEYLMGDIPGFDELSESEIQARIRDVRGTREAVVQRGDSTRTVAPAEQVLDLKIASMDPPVLRAVLAVGKERAVRPVDLVQLLSGAGCPEMARVHRTALLRRSLTGQPGLERVA